MRLTSSGLYQFELSPTVKALVVINVSIWFFLIVILQGLFLDKPYLFYWFGLAPEKLFSSFWIWQVLTYFFVHSSGIFHILFNMFALWMFGSELERFWGRKFFLSYYCFCGIGAGLIYLLVFALGSGFHLSLSGGAIPMVGASGAIFGLLFAYGQIFSQRVILFFFLFPLKARHFTLLIGMIEFVSLINSGTGNPVSHLAHLSGFLAGFLFLWAWRQSQRVDLQRWRRKSFRFKVIRNTKIKLIGIN